MTTTIQPTTAETISQLNRVSNNLSNAAYYLEHPETYNDSATTRETVGALISIALWQAAEFDLAGQAEAFKQ